MVLADKSGQVDNVEEIVAFSGDAGFVSRQEQEVCGAWMGIFG
jgi:hypothetical protein